jgi:hypothetical protein
MEELRGSEHMETEAAGRPDVSCYPSPEIRNTWFLFLPMTLALTKYRSTEAKAAVPAAPNGS